MGNQNTNQPKKHRLVDYEIPQNYYQSCHPNFLDFNVDQKQQFLFSGFILINSETQKWRKRIQPLLNTKYILTPCRIITSNYFFEKGCCSSELSDSIDRVNIAYQPFIYSLSRQLTSRKEKDNHFTEEQLWKILKYLTRALIQWHNVYPFERISCIMPQNIILNDKGNLRVVTQYSFPKDSFFNKLKPVYESPEDKTSSVIKYAQNQPNRYKILSADLYAIGMTILDCMILERSQQPQFSTAIQKINHMERKVQNKYSRQLKNIIGTLLSQDYKKRPNPHDLVQLAQISQTKLA